MHKLTFFLLILIDQATKLFAFQGNFGSFLNFLKPVFSKQLFRNDNLAFSIPFPQTLIYVLYAIILGLLFHWFIMDKNKTRLQLVAFILILAGAVSNILDRLMLGYVRDFIYVFWGNIFNLADLYIMAGIIFFLLPKKKEIV